VAESNVKGLAELQKFMDTLTPKMEANVMRSALRYGAEHELKAEVQANLLQNGSVRTGELISGIKVGTRKAKGKITALVKATGRHAFVANMLEFTGAKAHKIAAKGLGALGFLGRVFKSVEHPGFKAKPFMRPALDARGIDATIAVGNFIKGRLASKHGLDTAHVIVEGDE
jgi:hypothetical protein